MYPQIWKTKGAYFAWLRGQLRLIWSRFPPKIEFKKSKLVDPPVGYVGRAKKLGQCHYCEGWAPASQLEVDHVTMAGKLTELEDIPSFFERLLDCNAEWVLTHKHCHKIKSYAESKGVSFEEAALQKRVIEFISQDKEIVLAYLAEKEYSGAQVSNASKRRLLVESILRGEMHV
jgi:hypothetical protein